MSQVVTDRDVERALGVYDDLTVERQGGMSEIARLVHNDNLFTALAPVVEAKIADDISTAEPKLAADKVKWKARAHQDYRKALMQAARAAGELANARLRLKGAENTIDVWRTQNANNRRGHV